MLGKGEIINVMLGNLESFLSFMKVWYYRLLGKMEQFDGPDKAFICNQVKGQKAKNIHYLACLSICIIV